MSSLSTVPTLKLELGKLYVNYFLKRNGLQYEPKGHVRKEKWVNLYSARQSFQLPEGPGEAGG